MPYEGPWKEANRVANLHHRGQIGWVLDMWSEYACHGSSVQVRAFIDDLFPEGNPMGLWTYTLARDEYRNPRGFYLARALPVWRCPSCGR